MAQPFTVQKDPQGRRGIPAALGGLESGTALARRPPTWSLGTSRLPGPPTTVTTYHVQAEAAEQLLPSRATVLHLRLPTDQRCSTAPQAGGQGCAARGWRLGTTPPGSLRQLCPEEASVATLAVFLPLVAPGARWATPDRPLLSFSLPLRSAGIEPDARLALNTELHLQPCLLLLFHCERIRPFEKHN